MFFFLELYRTINLNGSIQFAITSTFASGKRHPSPHSLCQQASVPATVQNVHSSSDLKWQQRPTKGAWPAKVISLLYIVICNNHFIMRYLMHITIYYLSTDEAFHSRPSPPFQGLSGQGAMNVTTQVEKNFVH